ncbi:MAG TPA: hypothetical protein DCQ12_05050, partial [Candidatus Cloacimonas sp.]|nr:hypothetical protein [Candidatus Cloacimonas sp.]
RRFRRRFCLQISWAQVKYFRKAGFFRCGNEGKMATNFGVFFPRMGPVLPARVREGEKERGREAGADFGDASGCGRNTHDSGAL